LKKEARMKVKEEKERKKVEEREEKKRAKAEKKCEKSKARQKGICFAESTKIPSAKSLTSTKPIPFSDLVQNSIKELSSQVASYISNHSEKTVSSKFVKKFGVTMSDGRVMMMFKEKEVTTYLGKKSLNNVYMFITDASNCTMEKKVPASNIPLRQYAHKSREGILKVK
jgi:hypothetical protein